MRTMTKQEQREHEKDTRAVQSALRILRATQTHGRQIDDEDISVAVARLQNWLDENENRWVR